MAHIVPFRMAAARATGPEAGGDEGAQIIIFPGVRRQRHTEAPSVPSQAVERQQVRDVLELPD